MEKHLTCIKTYGSAIGAEIDKGVLETNGIEAVVLLDDIGGMYPGVGGARLLVREEDAEKALEILE